MNFIDPSRQLVCHLVTGRVNPADPSISPALWPQLALLAHREGLAPLLYWTLHARGWPEALPESTRQRLTEAYYASEAHNALLFTELAQFLPGLKQQGLTAVLLKGASLAPALYPASGLRPMSDVDLLVPQSDHPRVTQLLQARGYHEEGHDQAPGLHDMSDYHVGLKGGPAGRVIIELHWGLVSSQQAWYAAPIAWFWQHTEPWQGDDSVRQLTPVAHLVYLSAHALLQHGASQSLLIWFYDLHLLAQSGWIDWDELVAQVAPLRWGGVVGSALRAAQAAFGTHLPPDLLAQLAQVADPAVDRLVAFKQRFSGVRLLYDWYSLLALRGGSRWRYLLGMVFPQPAYVRWRYQPRPAWLWPIFYPYRWTRMLSEAFLALRRGILRAVK